MTDYRPILALTELPDSGRRGYGFEQLIREILPWSQRPPIAMLGPSEQLDAVFVWNNQFFIVEAKAKSDPITPGSPDWEDFELKLRKRHRGFIGLFCSLFPVSDGLLENARALNREGYACIVIHGPLWAELSAARLPLDNLLSYMCLHCRVTHRPVPSSVAAVKDWCYDQASIISTTEALLKRRSAHFLRRNLHPRHTAIYLPRSLDEQIRTSFVDGIMPSRLSVDNARTRMHGEAEVCTARNMPEQLLVIRDTAGSGKTTLGVNICLTADRYFCLAMSASEPDIDHLDRTLLQLGENYGVRQLIASNRPLVVIIDSLDEAIHIPGKAGEIKALIDFILNDLNHLAGEAGLIAFPVGLVFTVREDYWRTWQTLFDGRRHIRHFRNSISQFADDEFELALARYSHSYQFGISGVVPADTRRVLSIPFNLGVFAEAHEYDGNIDAMSLLDDDVLHLFFARKWDNLLKRSIPGLSRENIPSVCQRLALTCVNQGHNGLRSRVCRSVIAEVAPILQGNLDTVLLALLSEQIVVRDPDDPELLLFRHLRFVDYLFARELLSLIVNESDLESIDSQVEQALQSGLVGMHAISDTVKYICDRENADCADRVALYYERCEVYLRRNTQRLRSVIAWGGAVEPRELEFIRDAAGKLSPDVLWDSFFLFAAKSSRRDMQDVASLFLLVWSNSKDRPDKWKLLDKMCNLGGVLDTVIVDAVVASDNPKEWEVFLGYVLELPFEAGKREACRSLYGERLRQAQQRCSGTGWAVVRYLLRVLVEGLDYAPGEYVYETPVSRVVPIHKEDKRRRRHW